MARRQIVEITEDGRVLGVERGFLIVSCKKEILGKIPLDDIEAVICNSNYCLFTSSLANTLAKYSIPLLICDKIKKYPKSVMLALESNYRQGDVIQAQADASEPMKKIGMGANCKSKTSQTSKCLKISKKRRWLRFYKWNSRTCEKRRQRKLRSSWSREILERIDGRIF